MLIGVPKEIKDHEYRVGLTPASVRELISHGHKVILEHNAGAAIGFSNDDYINAGAVITDQAEHIFAEAEMIVKVKEPQTGECKMLREGQLLFAYLHLAADPIQTELSLASGATCIAYETITDDAGTLPLLAPMSVVAGRLSIQAGAHYLEKTHGERGVLLPGVPGVAPAKVTIIGGGVVGNNAAYMAVGMGADVTILDNSLPRLNQLDIEYLGRARCVYSTANTIEEYILQSDLVIGAVLIPGATAPKVLTRDMISHMQFGSVVVDVAIDQGGCFETSKATTHKDPIYIVDDVIHYCVTNMPGAVARTATLALNNAILPFARALADKGCQILRDDKNFLNGLNVHQGKVTNQAVSNALGYPYVAAEEALAGQGK